MSETQFRVLVGPYRVARRYAEAQGWSQDSYQIVVRGHQLARLDPARVAAITIVKLHTMTQKVIEEINQEIDRLRSLWTVPMSVAA
jgi:hypothetical protein